MKAELNHDYSISLIRLVATSFIITCHIMQYLDLELAWWFNVGVQMFLCMSGFLYGQKGFIEDDLAFYRKNISKILIDYYIVMVPVLVLYTFFTPDGLSIKTILGVLLTKDRLTGGGHLWYIPYCILCYLITPFLSRYFAKDKSRKILPRGLFLVVVAIVVIECFLSYFKSAWIICYIIGYFLGVIWTDAEHKLCKCISGLIGIAAILMNGIQIVLDYVMKVEFSGGVATLYSKYCNYAHVAFGVTLFLLLKQGFTKTFANGYPAVVRTLCDWSDQYSYDIYLVHQFVILGPFSLMALTGILGVNIVIILLVVVACAVVVNRISAMVKKKIKMAS